MYGKIIIIKLKMDNENSIDENYSEKKMLSLGKTLWGC